MSDINYQMQPVDEKPKKPTNKRKPSKYMPILTTFLESGHKLVWVDTEIESNYLTQQLNRVIKKNSIKSIKVSVRNGILYLEKNV